MIHIYYVSLGVVFALFLAQNFKTKVLTAHKNLLLECLVVASTLLLPGYGAVVGGLAYIGAVYKARCAPALKGVVALHSGC